jgi:hypothetical protein
MGSIPKKFHRIWLGNNKLPEEFAELGRTWKHHHPSWEMEIWSECLLPKLHNEWAYQNTDVYAAKSNIARYEILLHYGGVYIDTDFECLKCIEPQLDGVQCFVAWERDDVANNAIIGAVPGHPFIRDLVESLERNVRSLPDADPAVTQSGPYYLTEVLRRHPEVMVFPASMFYPYQWNEPWRRNEKFPDSYAVHHWTLSYRSPEELMRRKLGGGKLPCLSIVTGIPAQDGPGKLKWVLEGLCQQSVTNFEVIVVENSFEVQINNLLRSYQGRLNIVRRKRNYSQETKFNKASICNRGTIAARSDRVLFLDGDCIPDVDVVETHALFGDRAFIPFGFRRILHHEWIRQVHSRLDYQSLRNDSLEDPRRSFPFNPFYGDWRDVEGFGVSAPVQLLREINGFDEDVPDDFNFKDLARRLSILKARLIPTWNNGYVYHIDSPNSSCLLQARQTTTYDCSATIIFEGDDNYYCGL